VGFDCYWGGTDGGYDGTYFQLGLAEQMPPQPIWPWNVLTRMTL